MNFFNAFAFGVGMVALVNPCGFGLLPAYLGVFLGQKDDAPNRWISLNRAQGVGLAMTLGMLVVFGFFGLVLGGLQSAVAQVLPYFNIALGFGLLALGVAMFRGFTLTLKLPKMQKGGQTGSFASMFLFGMSYATASMTCTLGLFITAVNASSFTSGPDGGSNFFGSLGALVSYGLGMGLLATMITLLLAFGKRGLVGKFQSLLPKINKISAILLLLVGPFSILYGIWELQVLREWPLGEDVRWGWLNSFMGNVLDVQADVANWFSSDVTIFGSTVSRTSLLGWPFIVINLVVIVGAFVARRRRMDPAADAMADQAEELASA
jgi:cytochrome c biogenesis protein CcdA